MKNRAILAVVCSIIPALSGFLVAIYLYGLEGTPGLVRWMPKYARLFVMIALAGFTPALVFGLSALAHVFLAHRGAASFAAPATFIIAVIISLCCTAAYGLGIRAFYLAIHADPVGLPPIHRYDPAIDRPLVHLAFAADPHIGHPAANGAATEKIVDTVKNGGYDAFFILGDIGEMGYPGTDFENAARLLANGTPIVTLMGNHDSLVGGGYRYRKIFNPDLYFRIDSGRVHVIGLNILWDEGSFDKTQRAWLERNLSSIPEDDTTIVITHAFIRASGYTEPTSKMDWFDSAALIRDLAPMLEKGGVDLVVSGHNHFMEYLEAPGTGKPATGYAIVGTMGGKMDPVRTHVSDCSKWYLADQTGFLDVDLSGGRMKLTFRDETGKPLHEILR
jgi:UDP-2,3-diacylglucosamine pyrophosphatase LpxH